MRLGRFIHDEIRRMSFSWKPGGAYACGEPRSRRGLLLSSSYEVACSHQRRWMGRRLSQPTSPPPPPPLCEYRIDRIACTLSIIHLPSIEHLAPTRLSFFCPYIILRNSDRLQQSKLFRRNRKTYFLNVKPVQELFVTGEKILQLNFTINGNLKKFDL